MRRSGAVIAPPGGWIAFNPPPGVTTALIDPTTGMLANEYCPRVLTEVFPQGQVPTQVCDRHLSWEETYTTAAEEGEGYTRRGATDGSASGARSAGTRGPTASAAGCARSSAAGSDRNRCDEKQEREQSPPEAPPGG